MLFIMHDMSPIEQPLLRLVEEPTVSSLCGGAVLLNAPDGVVEDRHHEPVLWRELFRRVEVLRRQNHVRLEQVNRNSREIPIHVHAHGC